VLNAPLHDAALLPGRPLGQAQPHGSTRANNEKEAGQYCPAPGVCSLFWL